MRGWCSGGPLTDPDYPEASLSEMPFHIIRSQFLLRLVKNIIGISSIKLSDPYKKSRLHLS